MTEASRRNTLLATLAAVPMLLFLDVVTGVNAFYVRDMMHYHFPCKKILREIVLSGHFPYWNPWFSAGQPMAANPAHEVFYPLTWLILLPDYVYALQLLPLVHIVIATFTMYALLRSMDLGRPAAAVGALSFGIGGLVCSMTSLLHFLFSVSWLPSTCLFARRALLRYSARDAALASFFFGLQLLAGEPTTVLQTGVLLGLYAIYRGVQDKRTPAAVGRAVATIGVISLGAALVAAVIVIPMLDHFGDTGRARGFAYQTVSRWSMPFPRAAELIYPRILGHHSARDQHLYWGSALYPSSAEVTVPFYFSIYSGLLLTVLAMAGLLTWSRGSTLVLVIAVLSVIVAAGDYTPLLRILYDAGLAGSLRYPEKFALMLVLTIVIFGAQSLDRMLAGDERMRRMALVVLIATTLFAAAATVFSFTSQYAPVFQRIWSIPSSNALEEMIALSREGWITAAAAGVVLLLLLAGLHRLRRPLWAGLAMAFVIVDLGALISEVAPRVPIAFYRQAPAAVRQFPEKRDDFRIFHLANWAGGSKRANFYLQSRPERHWILRNGLAPVMPAAYGLRMTISGDFDRTELAPSSDFSRAVFELGARKPDDWLNIAVAMSNIRYIGIYRRPEEAMAQAAGVVRNLQPVKFVEGHHYPRYYFASEMAEARDVDEFVGKLVAGRFSREVAFVGAGAFAPARGVINAVHEWTNGARIDVTAAGRAFLVMSVTPHKYWRVTVDGKQAQAVVTNIGYQGVPIPAGRHIVEMRYRNPLIAVGGAISIATLAVVALMLRRTRETTRT
jgi:hypothetical protein